MELDANAIANAIAMHGPAIVALVIWAETRVLPFFKRALAYQIAIARKVGVTEQDLRDAGYPIDPPPLPARELESVVAPATKTGGAA